MVIFLIGYMGCGKSTIGRSLAARLGVKFMDMDREIERRAGMSVAEIFSSLGQEAFRAMEREFLAREFPAEGATIVATGGGAPCHDGNMETMRRAGHTIYFKMSPRKLAARLGAGRAKRPLIREMEGERLLEFISSSLRDRSPFYERANLTIDCDGVGDDYIASHVEHYIEHIGAVDERPL